MRVIESLSWVWISLGIVGSIAVIAGVWGEGWAEGRVLPYHRQQRLIKWFWRILLCGLALDLVGLIGSTATSISLESRVEELRKANNELSLKLKNWPLEQKVSSISAIMSLTVVGTNDERIPPWGTSNRVATMTICDNDVVISDKKTYGVTTPFNDLSSYDVETVELGGGGINKRGYLLRFQMDWDSTAMEVFMGFNNPAKASDVMLLTRGLRINLKFLPHESQIVSGNVKIIVNNNDPLTTKIFTIPPQTAVNDRGALGIMNGTKGFTLVTTNWDCDYKFQFPR